MSNDKPVVWLFIFISLGLLDFVIFLAAALLYIMSGQ